MTNPRDDVALLRGLLEKANEPYPTLLPEQDSRVGEAMAGRADSRARSDWEVRTSLAWRELVGLAPSLLGRLERAEKALREAASKFREYEQLHKAKVKPRASDVFYQAARNAYNAEVREKIARNREMAELCEAALQPSSEEKG